MAKKTQGLPSGTVRMFIEVLISKLTQYDKRAQSRGGYNPYALAQYLAAADRVRDAVAADLDSDSSASLQKLKKAIDRYLIPDFSPAKATKKQIDEFLASGKMPTLTTPPKRRVDRPAPGGVGTADWWKKSENPTKTPTVARVSNPRNY